MFLSIIVIKAQPHCKVLIFIYPDLCDPSMITLNALPFGNFTPPASFAWSTGGTTQNISVPNLSGSYSVTITDAVGCTATHSVNLIIPANFNYFIQGYNLCPGSEISLTVDYIGFEEPENATYAWSNGGTTRTIQTLTPGYYEVTITDPATGCSQVLGETITQLPGPTVEITGTLTICTGQTGMLTATGGPFNAIVWEPSGETTESITITGPGSYSVVVVNEFSCTDTDTIEVVSNGAIPSVSGPLTLCFGSSGTIMVTNPSQFISFQWNSGETTPTILVNAPGPYVVTATDVNGCEAEASVDVFIIDIALSGVVGDNTSCSSPNGFIDLDVSPLGSYNYLWSNGATSEDIFQLNGGTYSVTVTDLNSCTKTISYTISAGGNLPTIVLNQTPASCNQNNGGITLNVSPAGTYSYSWSNGSQNQNLVNVGAGTYTVTLTDANGCTVTAMETVSNSGSGLMIAALTSVSNTSCSIPNGSIDLQVNPPGNSTFLWSNGATTEDLSGLTAGTYGVTVTDAQGCTATGVTEVLEQLIYPVINTSPTSASCGQQNGSITTSISPAGTYAFLWSNGATSENLSAIPAGTYGVTVTAANGCTQSASETVANAGSALLITSITASPNTSCSIPNGSIDLQVNPPGNSTFLWSNGATTEDLSGLTAGTYGVTVTDAQGCTATDVTEVLAQLIYPVINTAPTSASCGQQNGSITTSVSPAGTYAYLWSNGATSENLSAIPAGTYGVTVTAANGCTQSASETVANAGSALLITSITASPNISCSIPNGSIDLQVNPPGNSTFLWSNGATTQDLSGLTAGTYGVTVTDAQGCTATGVTEVLEQLIYPVINTSPTSASCGQQNGSITASVSPAATYFFIWSNGATTENLSNIPAGTYGVTVTAGNGCTNAATETVVELPGNLSASAIVTNNTFCSSPNGSIDLTVTTSGSFTVLWSNGAMSTDLINISEGIYVVTITNAEGCIQNESFMVLNELTMPVLTSTQNNASCNQSNGSIILSVTPNTGQIFQWSNGVNTQNNENIPAGMYVVTVTSANGCSSSHTATVGNSTSLTASGMVTSNFSCSAPNGSIDLTIVAAGSYSVLWSTGSTAEDLFNLSEGLYFVTITEPNGCVTQSNFTVSSTVQLPELNATITSAICTNSNGEIELLVVSPGTHSFIWSNGDTTQLVSGLAQGTYVVTVTNSNGCSSSFTAVVSNVVPIISLSASISAETSCNVPDGSIDLSVMGINTISILWSNGGTNEDLFNIKAGIYTVSLSDANGCSAQDTFLVPTLLQYPSFSLAAVPTNCNQNQGSIELVLQSPGAFTFLWSTGVISQNLTGLSAGIYSVFVTSVQGCTTIDSVEVASINPSISSNAVVVPVTSCILPNGSIDISIMPAGNYQFLWSTGSVTEDVFNVNAGTHTVTISDGNGCATSLTFVMTTNLIYPNVAIVNTPSSCGNNNGRLSVTLNTPDSLSFLWSTGSNLSQIEQIGPGIYYVAVTNPLGCSVVLSDTIENMGTMFQSVATIDHNTSCTLGNGSILLNILPSGNYSFVWSNGSILEDQYNLVGGIYQVTISDDFGCTISENHTIANTPESALWSASIIDPTCNLSNGEIEVNVSNVTNFDLTWSDGESGAQRSALSAGIYTVTITSDAGCDTLASFVLENHGGEFVINGSVAPNVSCNVPNGEIWVELIPAGNYSVLWTQGETNTHLINLAEGNYQVTVTDQMGCSLLAIYEILNEKSFPNPGIEIFPPKCLNANGMVIVVASIDTSHFTYSINGGQYTERDTFFDLKPGPYLLSIKNEYGCLTENSLIVPELSVLSIELEKQIFLGPNQSQKIEPVLAGFALSDIDSVWWNKTIDLEFDGTDIISLLRPMLTAQASGTYEITVLLKDGCQITAEVNIIRSRIYDVFFPNVFQNSGEGISNNYFYPISLPGSVAEIQELKIYDRWGNLMFERTHFESDLFHLGWNGTFNGQYLNPAVFVWVCSVKFTNDSIAWYKGDVTIVK